MPILLIDEKKLNKELAAGMERARAEGDEKNVEIKEKLASGEELTRKQLRQLMREYEKKNDRNRNSRSGPEHHLRGGLLVSAIRYTGKRSTGTLTKQEVKGYERLDSLAVVE